MYGRIKMEGDRVGLLFTFCLGIFLLVGSLIVFLTKNNEKFVTFSISMAFGVIGTLILGELIPETLELFQTKYSFFKSAGLILICILLGMSLLHLLDLFVPDHHSHKEEHSKEHELKHIGLVSSIALILHNIIEGMAVYSTVTKSVELGLFVSLGVGLHNIPLGMVITSTFYASNKDKKKTILIMLGISLSTFVGGIIMYLLAGNAVSDTILAVLLGVTLGMLLYILLFELIPQIRHTKDKKTTISGIILGVFILLISFLLDK